MLHIRPPDDKGIKEAFPVVWWEGIQVSALLFCVTDILYLYYFGGVKSSLLEVWFVFPSEKGESDS